MPDGRWTNPKDCNEMAHIQACLTPFAPPSDGPDAWHNWEPELAAELPGALRRDRMLCRPRDR